MAMREGPGDEAMLTPHVHVHDYWLHQDTNNCSCTIGGTWWHLCPLMNRIRLKTSLRATIQIPACLNSVCVIVCGYNNVELSCKLCCVSLTACRCYGADVIVCAWSSRQVSVGSFNCRGGSNNLCKLLRKSCRMWAQIQLYTALRFEFVYLN